MSPSLMVREAQVSSLRADSTQGSGLGCEATRHCDPTAAFGPKASRGTGGLGVAASHLTGGRIAAYSSPGLEAEIRAHSIGNHH